MSLSGSQRLLECEEALRATDQQYDVVAAQNDLLTEALTELMSAARPYLEPGGYPYGNRAMAKARAALNARASRPAEPAA